MQHDDVEQEVGYALKRAQAALRSALDGELRGLDLTVPQYSCLEQLVDQPGRSNAELARGAFVSRQATHQLLTGLVSDGLVTGAGSGRAVRYRCTPAGRRRVAAATRVVSAVEDAMLDALGVKERQRLLDDLNRCVTALQAYRPSLADPDPSRPQP